MTPGEQLYLKEGVSLAVSYGTIAQGGKLCSTRRWTPFYVGSGKGFVFLLVAYEPMTETPLPCSLPQGEGKPPFGSPLGGRDVSCEVMLRWNDGPVDFLQVFVLFTEHVIESCESL